MNRRDFLRFGTPMVALLANGQIVRATEAWVDDWAKKKVKLRFAIASDGHYGQPNTNYKEYTTDVVNAINTLHKSQKIDFTVVNGDIVHDDKKFFPEVKQLFDQLAMKYYVSQGNHDHIDAAGWEATWKMPTNLSFSIRKNSFLIGTTADETGKYLCPDVKWFETALKEHAKQENIFIFIHINPVGLTPNAVNCKEWVDLIKNYPNIRAVFNGHDHDLDQAKVHEGMHYIFDAHYGGNWGTSYRGFRIVELLSDNTVVSYVMDPVKRLNELTLSSLQLK